jgi:hypothetical protein
MRSVQPRLKCVPIFAAIVLVTGLSAPALGRSTSTSAPEVVLGDRSGYD